MKPSERYLLCQALGFSYSGPRSARIAIIAYRMGLRHGRMILAGRPYASILRRLQAINSAYLAALSAEREAALL